MLSITSVLINNAYGTLLKRFLFYFQQDQNSIFPLVRISFHWVAPSGLFTTILVGAIIGRLFDIQDKIVMDAELFSPVVWWFLPAKAHSDKGEVRLSRASLSNIRYRNKVLFT